MALRFPEDGGLSMIAGRSSLTALSIACVVVALGAGSATATRLETPTPGGAVLVGADQEPPTFNPFIAGGEQAWAVGARAATLAGAFIVTPRLQYRNDLVSKATFTRRPFTVTYTIKPKARWSDGRKVTADDFIFTYRTVMDGRWSIASRRGYDHIARAEKIGRSNRVVRFRFTRAYAGWRDLFDRVLPRHALQGQDFNNVWRDGITNPRTGQPIASGPYILRPRTRGGDMVFERNRKYWGKRPHLDQITVRFGSTTAHLDALRRGAADIVKPPLTNAITPFLNDPSVNVQATPGPIWEKLDFNFGFKGGGHELLRRKFVREAIARGLNRQALVRTILGPINPRIPVLNSGIIMSNSVYHKPHWAKYSFDPNRARALLTQNGCTPAADGIFTCGGQRLSFRWMAFSGSSLQRVTFQIAQAQLKNVGIEVRPDFVASATAAQRQQAGDYDIFDYAWRTQTPDVSGWDGHYGCRRSADSVNFQGYCNRTVDRLLRKSNTELDQKKQAALVNQALATMSNDVTILPLYQLPSFLIHKRKIRGIIDNPLSVGAFWNLNQGGWWISGE